MGFQAGAAESGLVGRADHAYQLMKRGIRMDHARCMTALAVLNDTQAAGGIRRNAFGTGQQIQHSVLGGRALFQQAIEMLRVIVQLLQ